MFIVNDNGLGHAGDGLKRFAFPSLRETDGGLGDALYELGSILPRYELAPNGHGIRASERVGEFSLIIHCLSTPY
jgi:hypothetical protein